MVNSETLFHNKTVNKQVSIFNETIMNIFTNFVPSKLVTKNYTKNGRKESDYVKFQKATSLVSEMISRRMVEEQNHITLKINYRMNNTKTYSFTMVIQDHSFLYA